MNELDRMTRITGYMVVTIIFMAIGGLFIPNDQTKVIPKPVIEEISYDTSYSYEPIDIEPTPTPTKSVYYPKSYSHTNLVDEDLFDDEDDLESYYEEE
jgi:hypothetical protein